MGVSLVEVLVAEDPFGLVGFFDNLREVGVPKKAARSLQAKLVLCSM